jgi:glyoxalase family protein
MELTGLHHVSAITAHAADNVKFYTETLGLRLVKKTVNQDDTTSYHFFYGDRIGSPGSEVTFFDWRFASSNKPGAGAISTIALSVNSGAVEWWAKRLKDNHIDFKDISDAIGRPALDFADPEGQHLRIVGEPAAGNPWERSSVPIEYGVRGMHHVTLTVHDLSSINKVLVDILAMRQTVEYISDGHPVTVYETGLGGAGKQVHVVKALVPVPVRLGAGGVHHVAFRTPDFEEQQQWLERIKSAGLNVSGLIDRYYFRSIYFREPGGILFEIATDGPGFAADEDPEHLGERLALPPFLEPRRSQIEAGLIPI